MNKENSYKFKIDGVSIGEGAHSVVYKSHTSEDNRNYALKIISNDIHDRAVIREVFYFI